MPALSAPSRIVRQQSRARAAREIPRTARETLAPHVTHLAQHVRHLAPLWAPCQRKPSSALHQPLCLPSALSIRGATLPALRPQQRMDHSERISHEQYQTVTTCNSLLFVLGRGLGERALSSPVRASGQRQFSASGQGQRQRQQGQQLHFWDIQSASVTAIAISTWARSRQGAPSPLHPDAREVLHSPRVSTAFANPPDLRRHFG